ncbi:MAG: hypothetical protein HRT86_15460 [Ilumatobacteraceae bacterium]|nr:hypothetical protein [Ilumatobacteraceae bacterium]
MYNYLQMKEKTLVEMKNQLEGIKRVLQHVVTEITHLRELGVGTLETLKLMPGYEDAVKQLQENMEKQIEEQKKAEQNGTSE